MLDTVAIDDHVPLISILSEQVELEATALQAADDDATRLLHLGGLATLTRILMEEMTRLRRVLLASPPTLDSSDSTAQEDALQPG